MQSLIHCWQRIPTNKYFHSELDKQITSALNVNMGCDRERLGANVRQSECIRVNNA